MGSNFPRAPTVTPLGVRAGGSPGATAVAFVVAAPKEVSDVSCLVCEEVVSASAVLELLLSELLEAPEDQIYGPRTTEL